MTGVSRSLLPCLVSQFADWGLYGKNYLGIGKEELIKLPLVGFPGTNPCKIHRDIPVKLPLRLNLTPLVTITNVSLAKCAPGCWIRLPYMAHWILNPRTEKENNARCNISVLHTPQKFWKFIAPSKFSNTLTSGSRYLYPY